jgi:protein MAK16
MIVDEVIWEIINNGHCSFKTKIETNTFCRNEHNVTGLCNRNSCPLSNSRYATVLEEKGACYLVMKTAERAHTPKDLWEKIKLDKSYNKALAQIDEQLAYWPEFLKHKCKQRFTRFRQILVKKRKMKLRDTEVYEVVSRKAEKREKSRGKKAVKAALIENHIEEEILERMRQGKYDTIMNIDHKLFGKVLDKKGVTEDVLDYEYDIQDEDNVFVSELNKLSDDDNIDFEDDDYNGIDDFNTTNDFSSNNKDTKSKGSNEKTGKKGNLLNKKRRKLNLEYEDAIEEKDTNYNLNN